MVAKKHNKYWMKRNLAMTLSENIIKNTSTEFYLRRERK